MTTLLSILAILAFALIVLIPLIERFAPKANPEQQAKLQPLDFTLSRYFAGTGAV